MHNLRKIVDIARHGIVARSGPRGIAIAAQIGRDDVIVVAERLRHPVPVSARWEINESNSLEQSTNGIKESAGCDAR